MTRRSKLEPDDRKSWRVGHQILRMSQWSDRHGAGWRWRDGCLISSLGIAAITQWRSADGKGDTTMIEVVDRHGHLHCRWWKRVHPDRTCSRLARLMLEELP
jgi:hypothetical protein